jgi:hypothetical protein
MTHKAPFLGSTLPLGEAHESFKPLAGIAEAVRLPSESRKDATVSLKNMMAAEQLIPDARNPDDKRGSYLYGMPSTVAASVLHRCKAFGLSKAAILDEVAGRLQSWSPAELESGAIESIFLGAQAPFRSPAHQLARLATQHDFEWSLRLDGFFPPGFAKPIYAAILVHRTRGAFSQHRRPAEADTEVDVGPPFASAMVPLHEALERVAAHFGVNNELS